MRFAKTLIVVAIAAVALIALACGGGGDDDAGGGQDAGVREIHLRMTDQIRFEPPEIQLEAGRPVRLVIDNSEAASIHDFSVMEIPVADVSHEGEGDGGHMGMDSADEYDLHIALESGSDRVIEFTPTAAGEYEFLCTVTGHAQAGMTGRLIVT
jgi:uncharacterized cupredoxin-like copper-binding protein